MSFAINDRVWWRTTPHCVLIGTVKELDTDTTIAVKPDDDPDLLYLDVEQLQLVAEMPDGIYPLMDYHSNPARLSPNAAKKLLEPGGPAKYDWERRNKRPSTPAFDFGKVAHKLVLGEGDKFKVLHPEIHGVKKDGAVADNPRATSTWKQAEKAARAEGLTPIASDEYLKAVAMAGAVHAHPLAHKLLNDGDAEHWLYATENNQGFRLRPDWMTQSEGRLHLIEYKTAASADPNVFERKAYDFGYHLAFAFAVTAARILELDEAPAYVYVVQEKDPPYLVSVCELDADAFKLGREHMRKAIEIYQQCMDTGVWPGYGEGIHSISLPAWAFTTNQRTVADLFAEAE